MYGDATSMNTQSHELAALTLIKPEIAKFLKTWRDQHEATVYTLSLDDEVESFCEAAYAMVRHVAANSYTVQMNTVLSEQGVQTIYFACRPKESR